jgi:hypothetical protein
MRATWSRSGARARVDHRADIGGEPARVPYLELSHGALKHGQRALSDVVLDEQ